MVTSLQGWARELTPAWDTPAQTTAAAPLCGLQTGVWLTDPMTQRGDHGLLCDLPCD